MSEKLQEAMAEIITKAVSSVEAAGSFIVEQTPDVIKQLLTWKLTEALFFVGLGVVIGLLSIPFFKLGKYFGAQGRIDNNNDDVQCFLFYALTCICVFIGIVMFFVNMHTVLYIWMAPKVYLIEYASHLAK